jgi:hypothetical protein
MLGCSTTCLSGAVTKANDIINGHIKAAKEEAHRLNQNDDHNQELIRQNIKYLNLFSHDQESKQLVTQLMLKLVHQ